MSKSLARVRAALQDADLAVDIHETENARTALDAAEAVGCTLDQIAKSIIFEGVETGTLHLFITAGGNQVSPEQASALAGEPLGRADANRIRAVTGFAIGGVSPIGHLSPISRYFDPRLLDFDMVWAAAGTPRHLFGLSPQALLDLSQAQLATFCHPAD